MADKDRTNHVSAPPRSPDEERAALNEKMMPPELEMGHDPNRRSARPDPDTGEVPAGPGDAGLEDRPEVNTGSPGTKQMSNKRLLIGLGIAAGLAILAYILAMLF